MDSYFKEGAMSLAKNGCHVCGGDTLENTLEKSSLLRPQREKDGISLDLRGYYIMVAVAPLVPFLNKLCAFMWLLWSD